MYIYIYILWSRYIFIVRLKTQPIEARGQADVVWSDFRGLFAQLEPNLSVSRLRGSPRGVEAAVPQWISMADIENSWKLNMAGGGRWVFGTNLCFFARCFHWNFGSCVPDSLMAEIRGTTPGGVVAPLRQERGARNGVPSFRCSLISGRPSPKKWI